MCRRAHRQQIALNWASRNARLLAPLVTLISMFIFFSLVTDVFLTTQNLQNIVTQIAPIAVAATGGHVCAALRRDRPQHRVGGDVHRRAGGLVLGRRHDCPRQLGDSGCHPRRRGDRTPNGHGGFLGRHPLVHDDAGDAHHRPGMSVFVSEGKPIFEVPPVLKQPGASAAILGIPVIGLVALVCCSANSSSATRSSAATST